MKTQGKIVIMVFITINMGKAKNCLDTMEEMLVEMNERLSMAEEKLTETEDELAATKAALNKAIICQIEDHALTKSKTEELERKVAILRAPPFIHACGSNSDYLPGSYMTIPYTSLLYSSTNTEGGGLDITTGVFTAPHGGSYTVYWNTQASLDVGEAVGIYLQKNGENIQESHHYSRYSGPSGVVYDQGKLGTIQKLRNPLRGRWEITKRLHQITRGGGSIWFNRSIDKV